MDTPTTTTRKTPSHFHIRVISLTIAVLALLSDLTTKWWALDKLADGSQRSIIGDLLKLRLVFNPGAAFSMGDNATLIITGVAVVVVCVLIYYIWNTSSLHLAAALALLLGGALGNIYDRFFSPPYGGRGHVIDFIDYNGYFVGNVADIWIVLAVFTLAFIHLRETRTNA